MREREESGKATIKKKIHLASGQIECSLLGQEGKRDNYVVDIIFRCMLDI